HKDFPARTIALIGEETGLAFREAENHFEAQGAKDAYVSASGALNTLAVALMKIANDIRHLASGPTSGLAEIRLPAVQPGSSIMPGKVNPVMSEATMMVCARVMGNHTTITICGQHGNFELKVMMPVAAYAFLESVTILANVMAACSTQSVGGFGADCERCREMLELNASCAKPLPAAIDNDGMSPVAKQAPSERRQV